MTPDPWIRNGIVSRIIDGDSLVVEVDLGYRVWHRTHIRLLGIDSPERGEVGWAEARDHLAQLAPADTPCIVQTVREDKYGGRWLATVQVAGVDLAAAQLAGGYAAPYDGGARA